MKLRKFWKSSYRLWNPIFRGSSTSTYQKRCTRRAIGAQTFCPHSQKSSMNFLNWWTGAYGTSRMLWKPRNGPRRAARIRVRGAPIWLEPPEDPIKPYRKEVDARFALRPSAKTQSRVVLSWSGHPAWESTSRKISAPRRHASRAIRRRVIKPEKLGAGSATASTLNFGAPTTRKTRACCEYGKKK